MSTPPLSPHKALLLAVRLAAHADVGALARLVHQHGAVLDTALVLRVLLTYLPETVPSDQYVGLLETVCSADYGEPTSGDAPPVDTAYVDNLTPEAASRSVRKLRLLSLDGNDGPNATAPVEEDAQISKSDLLRQFLVSRCYRVDEEAGLLTQLPGLLVGFAAHDETLRAFAVSVVLPWCRRNCEYYPQSWTTQPLKQLDGLSDSVAIDTLLSESAQADPKLGSVGRDLRSLVGPWLHSEARWRYESDQDDTRPGEDGTGNEIRRWKCAGWEHVLQWLCGQAPRSWMFVVHAFLQWAGPDDMDLGPFGQTWLALDRLDYLRRRYHRAGLAAAYQITASSTDALGGVYIMSARIRSSVLAEHSAALDDAAVTLAPVSPDAVALFHGAGSRGALRSGLLDESNALTTPGEPAILLLQALVLSAYLLAKADRPMTIRQTGELRSLSDERDQTSLLKALVRALDRNPLKTDDDFWAGARAQLLWLHSWGHAVDADGKGAGIFGRVSRAVVEASILDALLANSRLSLARAIYEEDASEPPPLSASSIRNAVVSAAMHAYDNAANPNRTRGGLKKCNDIIHAFPQTLPRSHEAARRIECLLKATHSLSDYRLVLKQGSPFSPVVLRTHSDPLSIIDKVLEQNPKSYTNLPDLLDLGANLVKAGLMSDVRAGRGRQAARELDNDNQNKDKEIEKSLLLVAEWRILAMTIEAALAEDDFETAYSYVTSRLESPSLLARTSAARGDGSTRNDAAAVVDQWSWTAALKAGQYLRTARSTRPTHLGTASANPEIRHLEQRLECLATALRIAPAPQLQEILKTFRRCEEQLDAALKQEADNEHAWDDAADMHRSAPMPGAFGAARRYDDDGSTSAVRRGGGQEEDEEARRNSARPQRKRPTSAGDEAPMSLFDLTARIASQNLSTLTALSGRREDARDKSQSRIPRDEASSGGSVDGGGAAGLSQQKQQQPRTRRRDQLREAAVGTLVSSVGWLVGVQPTQQEEEEEEEEEENQDQEHMDTIDEHLHPASQQHEHDGQPDAEQDDWDW